MADRYIRFKVEIPKDLKKKKDIEIYRKLEYLGTVDADGKITIKFLRKSIKSNWERYADSYEYMTTKDEENKKIYTTKEVQILENMNFDEYINRYYEKLLI